MTALASSSSSSFVDDWDVSRKKIGSIVIHCIQFNWKEALSAAMILLRHDLDGH